MHIRIKQARQLAGLTQQQLANQIGLTRNYVAILESGQREPSDRTVADLARVMGVREKWLKTGEGDMLLTSPSDDIAAAFGSLAAMHNPVIDGFALWLKSRTPQELTFIAEQLESCADFLSRTRQNYPESAKPPED